MIYKMEKRYGSDHCNSNRRLYFPTLNNHFLRLLNESLDVPTADPLQGKKTLRLLDLHSLHQPNPPSLVLMKIV